MQPAPKPPHQTVTKVTGMNHARLPNHRQPVSIARGASKYESLRSRPARGWIEKGREGEKRDLAEERNWKSTKGGKKRREERRRKGGRRDKTEGRERGR